MLVKLALRMLARWPELPIQPATTELALEYPAATFSPHVFAENPAREMRTPASEPSDPAWLIELCVA